MTIVHSSMKRCLPSLLYDSASQYTFHLIIKLSKMIEPHDVINICINQICSYTECLYYSNILMMRTFQKSIRYNRIFHMRLRCTISLSKEKQKWFPSLYFFKRRSLMSWFANEAISSQYWNSNIFNRCSIKPSKS